MASENSRGGGRDAGEREGYAEKVAAKIIEALEQGTAPWQKPWKPGELRLPHNPTTDQNYRGINSMWLMMQGHDDPRWMTYKQAEAQGAQVKKGEKGTVIQYWKFRGQEPEADDNGKPILDGEGKQKTREVEYERPRVFHAVVFNATQIDGLPPREAKPTMPEWQRHEQAEAILQASDVPMRHIEGNRAYYSPAKDEITMPERTQFPTADGYYATALHELGHATGHPSRLDRDLSHPFGSEGYAREELRAEIASLMLGERLEIGHDPGQHSAYVGSWIKALQEDPREIFRAAADAEKIAGYVQGLTQQREQSQERTDAESIDYKKMLTPEVMKHMRDSVLAAQHEGNDHARIEADRIVSNFGDTLTPTQYAQFDQARAEDTLFKQLAKVEKELGLAAPRQDLPVESEAKTMSESAKPERNYLAVPYREKDEAKAAGARWDKDQKAWYAPEGADVEKLARWMPGNQAVVREPKIDPQQEFAQALKEANFILDSDSKVQHPVMNGKIQRCKVEGDVGEEKSGAYIGHLDGHPAGYIQNFRENVKENWKSSQRADTLTAEDRARLAQEAQEKLAAREAEREATHEAVSDRLTAAMQDGIWKHADPQHPYLVKKGLAGDAGGAFQDDNGNLLIPAHDKDGRLWTAQRIDGEGRKGFEKDGKLQGNHYMAMSGPAADVPTWKGGPIVVAEGWATGETIRRATGATVYTAFSAYNLEAVAEIAREQHPDRAILIAGDNDHQKEREGKPNTGREYAEKAAKAVGGYAAIPDFGPESKGSDWNDWAREKGTEELKKSMEESALLADRRKLEDAHRLGHDAERIGENIREHQAEAEMDKSLTATAAGDMQSAYAALRNTAEREQDRQDKSDELNNGQEQPVAAGQEDQEQEQKQQKQAKRGTGRSRSR